MVLALAPGNPGSGLVFENEISRGVIPREFIPAVEKGVRQAAESGVLAGNKVTDVLVTLCDGSFHEVDSSALAFQTAAGMAFHEGMQMGKPVLMEPICRLEVLVPGEYMGDVLGQLTARRCEIEGTEPRPGGIQAIRAMVPLREMFGYATQLRSATHGHGLFSMEFDHFTAMSAALTRQILQGGW